MTRQIQGLKWARQLQARPKYIPKGRPRGVKKQGILYENAVAAQLGHAQHGIWFEFEDQAGKGCCQPDLILASGPFMVILEVKLSWTQDAYAQIDRLYIPVVSEVYGRPAVGLQVCKRVTMESRSTSITSNILEALALVKAGHRVTLHWLGKFQIPGLAKLGPSSANPRPAPIDTSLISA